MGVSGRHKAVRRFNSLTPVLRSAGGSLVGLLQWDTFYRDAAYSEIDKAYKGYRRFLFFLGLQIYRREGHDCENFAELYRCYMQYRYAQGFEADPTGICDYARGGDINDWRCINFRICGNNVYFIEPQRITHPRVNLNREELASLKYRIL